MVRYHYFDEQQQAHDFLAAHRINGGLGYYVGRTGDAFDHSNPYEAETDAWRQWRKGWIASASGKDLAGDKA